MSEPAAAELAQADPKAFEIHLELFEGPLALLIHLIEKNNLNIFDIPIAKITREYLDYLEQMKRLDMEIAGDFLVMATTLMQIKTRMLLPRPAEEEGGEDPRDELTARLLLYQQFVRIARDLEVGAKRMENYGLRPGPVFEREEFVIVQHAGDLYAAFQKVLDEFRASRGGSEAIAADPHPVEAKIEKILAMLKEHSTLSLFQVFQGEPSRVALAACFLAVLELIKRGAVIVLQKIPFGDIFLARGNYAEAG